MTKSTKQITMKSSSLIKIKAKEKPMKNNKPIALILFGLALILSAAAFTGIEAALDLVTLPIICTGLLISLVGLIWALKQK